jgi:cytidylate kinase
MTTIAIDGPGGAGKSTLGRALAAGLGLESLDTGAMYRAVAVLAARRGIPITDGPALGELTRAMSLEVSDVVVLEGEDVTAAIRAEEIDGVVSEVARHPEVRSELVRRQQAWVRERGGGVLEGRDIGTVVLPDADLKIYLTASEEVRAGRRAGERAVGHRPDDVERARRAIDRRDHLDSTRATAPLQTAPDAVVVDSTSHSPGELVELALKLLAERTGTAPRDGSAADRPDGQAPHGADDRGADDTGADESSAASPTVPVLPTPVTGDGRRASQPRTGAGHDGPTPQPGRGARAFYAVCRVFAVGASRAMHPGRVIGRSRVPRAGAYIIAPNHRSNLDWLVVARLSRRRLRYVVKAEVWKVPAVGHLIELLGAFPVHRGSADREALDRCRAALEGGEPLVMFPEGTRQDGPQVGEILEGVAYLALRVGVPIVPVGLAGTAEVMPRGRRLPRPGRVLIVIGEPIRPPAPVAGGRVPRAAVREVTEELRRAIQQASDDAATLLGRSQGGGLGSSRRYADPPQRGAAGEGAAAPDSSRERPDPTAP